MSKFEGTIYQVLSRKPVTVNVITKLKISHKKTFRALMNLVSTKEGIYYKNSGRIHHFWRELL